MSRNDEIHFLSAFYNPPNIPLGPEDLPGGNPSMAASISVNALGVSTLALFASESVGI